MFYIKTPGEQIRSTLSPTSVTPAILLSPFSLAQIKLLYFHLLSFFPFLSLHLQLVACAPGSRDVPLMYCEAKQAAGTYQTAKEQWVRALQENGLGTWVI